MSEMRENVSQHPDEIVQRHLANYPSHAREEFAEAFAREGLVRIDDLLPKELADALSEEAVHLLRHHSRRREVVLPSTGNTPRAYRSVARDVIATHGKLIPWFFHNEAIREFLSEVAGERLHKVPYEPEEFIVNSQEAIGDTHGWHFDDYTYALIWIAEAPDPFAGGRVEYIPHVSWNKEDPEGQLRELLINRKIHSMYMPAGSCYLMQTHKTLHRVSPLTDYSRRTVIVFTYANDQDLQDSDISHETMEAIYAPEIT